MTDHSTDRTTSANGRPCEAGDAWPALAFVLAPVLIAIGGALVIFLLISQGVTT